MFYEGSCHCDNIAFAVEGEFTQALIATARFTAGGAGFWPSCRARNWC